MYTFKKTLNAIQVLVLLAIFIICQNKASAQVTLDFTGVPNGNIGDYYNGGSGPNYGISFPVGAAADGWCSASTNPLINIPAGFTTTFQVDWAVCIGFRIRIYDQVDGGGNQIAMTEYVGSSGTSTVNFCGTGRSVRLERFSCPGTGYDNIYFGPAPVPVPEINLQGNNVDIADGDLAATTTDDTDFGSITINTTLTKTYTIQNTGTSDLTVSSITKTGTNQSEFVIGGISLPATIAAGNSTTFTVALTPTVASLRSAVIHVISDDCNESDYDFAVQGTGAYEAAKGLHFDGINDQVIVPHSSNLPFNTTDFTIEAWIYQESTTSPYPTIFAKKDNNLVIWTNTGASNLLSTRVGGVQLNGTTVPLNTWTHVAVTFSATTAKLYQNGTLMSTETTTQPNSTAAMYLGFWAGQSDRIFKGKMDDVRIWASARTQAEIQTFMNEEIAAMPNCLVAYYKFNQGSAGATNTGLSTLTDIADATLENGTLTNFALSGTTSNWAAGSGISESGSSYLSNLPDIHLTGNNTDITDGTKTVNNTNFTNFGTTLNGVGKAKTFTIQNQGNENLTISSISFSGANAADFSVSGISLPLTLAPNATQNFFINSLPSATGTRTATINIVNDDCDESNYDFAVQSTSTNTFTFSSSGGSWATAANWDVEVAPVTANITNGRAVVIGANCTMNDVVVTFPSGTSLTVNSGINLSPSLNTYITINSGATLTLQAGSFMSQGRIINSGTLNISGSYSAFYMTNNAGGTLNILSGGSYTCPACAESFQAGSFINNTGTMNASTGSTWNATITNNVGGTISDGALGAQIQIGASGILHNYGTFVSRTAGTSGTFNNYSTGILTMPATCSFSVKSGSTFTNSGTITLPSNNTGFNVNSGGTLTNNGTIKGIGALVQSGTLTNSNTAIFAPGNSPGTLPVSGNLDLGSALYNCEVNGTSAGQFDVLSVTGTATLSSSRIHVIFASPLVSGTTFDVLTAGTVSGTMTYTFANTGTGNVTGISLSYPGGNKVRVTVSSPLPIELVHFTGKEREKNVILEWETASELNNEGFTIERSTDGRDWIALGFVAGNGTTTATQRYSFLDENPMSGTNYYRLRQTDIDGKEELTHIVLVHVKNEATNIRIFPNPVVSGTRLTVEIQGDSEAPLSIDLFNSTGQLVQSITNHTGTQTLDTSDWPTGVYTLRAGRSVAKIVVKH